MAERRTLGLMECINCGARIEMKLNTAGHAHYACNGSVDPTRKACGLIVGRFGKTDTKTFIETLEGKPHDKGATDGHERGQEREPEKPAAETGDREPEPAPAKGRGELDGYVFE
jgi:hypothetical protein